MKVVLVSAFKNSERYIERFFNQVEALRDELMSKGHSLNLVLGEGDSKNYHTREMLFNHEGMRYKFVDVTHGGKDYGSVIDKQRWLQCAYVGNILLANIPDDCDLVIYVESDLVWQTDAMMELLIAATSGFDIVAPKVVLKREGWSDETWYDTFAFSHGGVNFGHVYPYHDVYVANAMVEVDSAGSCLVSSREVFKKGWFTAEGSIVGLCNVLRSKGYHIYLDTNVEVWHE